MVASRTSLNYLEHLPVILLSTIVSGFGYPIAATSIGAVYFVGRILFTIGFTSSLGIKARFPGFAILMLALMAQLILAVVACLKITGTIH